MRRMDGKKRKIPPISFSPSTLLIPNPATQYGPLTRNYQASCHASGPREPTGIAQYAPTSDLSGFRLITSKHSQAPAGIRGQSRAFADISNTREYSRTAADVHEHPKVFASIRERPGCSRTFPDIRGHSTILEWPRTFAGTQGYSRAFASAPDVREHSRKFADIRGHSRAPEDIHEHL